MIALRLVPAFGLAAAIAFACGPRGGPRSPAAQAPERTRTMSGPAILASLDVRQRGSDIAFLFRITNNAKKTLELVFPNGQTHDLVVMDANGEEIWRWSSGRMFTQALQNKIIDGYDNVVYQVTWKAPPSRSAGNAGNTYTAIATLLSENHPMEQRAEFAIK